MATYTLSGGVQTVRGAGGLIDGYVTRGGGFTTDLGNAKNIQDRLNRGEPA